MIIHLLTLFHERQCKNLVLVASSYEYTTTQQLIDILEMLDQQQTCSSRLLECCLPCYQNICNLFNNQTASLTLNTIAFCLEISSSIHSRKCLKELFMCVQCVPHIVISTTHLLGVFLYELPPYQYLSDSDGDNFRNLHSSQSVRMPVKEYSAEERGVSNTDSYQVFLKDSQGQ